MDIHTILNVDGINVFVTKKPIKMIYIRVVRPDGRVTVSAPLLCDDKYIIDLVKKRMVRILKEVERVKSIDYSQLKYVSGEVIPFFGKGYTLKVVEGGYHMPEVMLRGEEMELYISTNSSSEDRELAIYDYYFLRTSEKIKPLLRKWMGIWGVEISSYRFKRLKSIWGSCHVRKGKLTFNIELAKYPPECLEYIVAHELLHMLIPGHGKDFKMMLDDMMPNWRAYDRRLKEPPIEKR